MDSINIDFRVYMTIELKLFILQWSLFNSNLYNSNVSLTQTSFLVPSVNNASADLEVQLVQLNHCEGVYSNYWNTLLRNLKLTPYINFYV